MCGNAFIFNLIAPVADVVLVIVFRSFLSIPRLNSIATSSHQEPAALKGITKGMPRAE